ncbi:MAG TPA: hypothetical protein VFU21_14130, partial [Kofleriaceae bacterium]|nr:hypothetical protein [Kofleriaceae bacterium]
RGPAPAPPQPAALPAAAPAPPGSEARPTDDVLTEQGVPIQDELGLLPNLRLGSVTAGAGVDLPALMDRLRARLPVLRGCFRREVTLRPTVQLTLTLSLEIDERGQVAHAELQGTPVVALRRCIASALAGEEGFPSGPARIEASLIVTPVASSGGGR